MRSEKVERIIQELCRSGFSMGMKEFYETTVFGILEKYGIKEKLEMHDYIELSENITDLCAEHDLKKIGLGYLDENDFPDK